MKELVSKSLALNKQETSASSGEKNSSTSNAFETSFHSFSLRFDEWNFAHWWWFLIAFYLGWLFLCILWDMQASQVYKGFLCQNPDYYFINTDINCSLTIKALQNYSYHFFIIGQFFLLLLFNRWRKKIPTFLQELESKKIISSSNQSITLSEEYHNFLIDYQKALFSNKRYIVIFVLFIGVLLYLFIWSRIFGFKSTIIVHEYNADFSPFYASDHYLVMIDNILSVLAALSILLLCYFVTVGGWVIYITGLYIDKLTTRFKLNIQPDHPDNCGGLKMLGSFCLNMAMIIVLLAAFQSFYGLTFNPKSFWSLGILDVIVPCVLVLAYLAFLLPLFHIHRQMVNRKDEDKDEYANRIGKLKINLRSSLDDGELDKAKIIKDEIEVAELLNPSKTNFQTWPFNTGILLTFLLPQLIPVLSTIIPLIFHS